MSGAEIPESFLPPAGLGSPPATTGVVPGVASALSGQALSDSIVYGLLHAVTPDQES